ncbi:MAG: ADOP family duplicated permease [Gemmatimonadota bacterium]|nr:ADOP family duplicated permease [Gemmatimonadota bacterium]
MSGIVGDFRYALRSLAKSRGYTTVAILSLGLALGITTTMFALVDATINPYMPFREPERLYRISPFGGDWKHLPNMYQQFLMLRREGKFHGGMMASSFGNATVQVGREVREVRYSSVSANAFSVLGVVPVMGRTFPSDDGLAADESLALISQRLWNELRGERSSLDGFKMVMNGRTYDVIGVLPPGVLTPQEADIWVPIPAKAIANGSGLPSRFVSVTFRLRPGATSGTIRPELDVLANRMSLENGSAANTVWYRVDRVSTAFSVYNDVHRTLAYAVLIVLLIGCVNLSQLVRARGISRRRELAIRAALGGTRAQLMRQLLSECSLLCLAGGALGVMIAILGIRIAAHSLPPTVRAMGLVAPDLNWHIFAFGLGTALATILTFGLVPALRASRVDPGDALKDGAGTTTGRVRHRYDGLVTIEVGLSLMLLFAAALIIRSTAAVNAYDYGYNVRGLVAAQMYIWKPDLPDSEVTPFYKRVLDDASRIPTVRSVALHGGDYTRKWAVTTEDPGAGVREHSFMWYDLVTPGFLRTLEIPVIAGRDFAEGDVTIGAVIVNQAAAKEFWPFGDPVGQRIKLGNEPSDRPWLRVVGVARDVFLKESSKPDPPPRIFVVTALEKGLTGPNRGMSLIVRGDDPPGILAMGMRRAIANLSPLVAGHTTVASWTAPLDQLIEMDEFLGSIFATFAAFGLLVSAIGLYGVLAYTVVQRYREFAVRIALGAEHGDVARLVLHDGAVMLLAGTGFGAFFALAASVPLSAYLFGFSSFSPLVLIAAEVVLVGVGLAACWIPARQATRSDPVAVLRAN